MGDARQSTPTIFKTLNPEWNVSFEMPIVGVPLLECICWDHDRFGKDYLGEFDIALEDIFIDGQLNPEVGGTRSDHRGLNADSRHSPNGIPSNRNGSRPRRRTALSRAKSCCNSPSLIPRAPLRRRQTHIASSSDSYSRQRTMTRFPRPISMTSIGTKRPPMKPMT